MWKNVKDKSVVKNLKAITSFEELEKVLKYIQNMQSENIRTLVSEQFDMLPRLKSTNESGGQRIVKISGLNSDGRVDVFWDITVPARRESTATDTRSPAPRSTESGPVTFRSPDQNTGCFQKSSRRRLDRGFLEMQITMI